VDSSSMRASDLLMLLAASTSGFSPTRLMHTRAEGRDLEATMASSVIRVSKEPPPPAGFVWADIPRTFLGGVVMPTKPTKKAAAPVVEKVAAPVVEKVAAPVVEKEAAPVVENSITMVEKEAAPVVENSITMVEKAPKPTPSELAAATTPTSTPLSKKLSEMIAKVLLTITQRTVLTALVVRTAFKGLLIKLGLVREERPPIGGSGAWHPKRGPWPKDPPRELWNPAETVTKAVAAASTVASWYDSGKRLSVIS